MALPVWINNLIAYSLQIAILAATGTLLAYVFRLRMPRVTLIYWQILLVACLCLPLLQRWEHPVFTAVTSEGMSESLEPTISNIAIPMDLKPTKRIPWESIALALLAGISLRLMWLAIGFFRLRRFQWKSRMLLEELPSVQDMQWRTGVRVSLLLSGEIDSPVTFGIRPPTIILPLSFKNLSEPCQRAVLCHELLHVRRRDWILIIVEEIVRSVFWFHPAIWWLLSRIHLSREQAVDHEVVRLTGSRQPYLDSLLEFAQAHGRPRSVPAPLFLKERHLVQRVALLVKEVSMSRSRLAVSMSGILILLIGMVRLSAGWFPLTGSPVIVQEQSVGSGVNAPQRNPIRVGGDIQESKLIHKIEPVYPAPAVRARVQGLVVLEVTINEQGFVSETKIVTGHPFLSEAAIDAVKQWQYSTTLLNGEPVPVVTMVKVYFRFGESSNKSGQTDGIRTLKSEPVQGAGVPPKEAFMQPPGQYANPDVKPPKRTSFLVDGDVQESKLIYKVNPSYPEEAKSERLEGIVHLEVTINEEGFVSGIIAAPGDYEVLENAAIATVKQWRYSPTFMNGEPIPVTAPVTVIYSLRDFNDLAVTMDATGNLNRDLSSILKATGKIEIRIAPNTPFRVVDHAIRELAQRGVQKIKLSMPFVFYHGQLFYAGTPANAQQQTHDIATERLVSIAWASGQFEKGKPYRLTYRLYVNEAGEAVGLQQLGGAKMPDIENDLMRNRTTPALLGADPVPCMRLIGIYFIG